VETSSVHLAGRSTATCVPLTSLMALRHAEQPQKPCLKPFTWQRRHTLLAMLNARLTKQSAAFDEAKIYGRSDGWRV